MYILPAQTWACLPVHSKAHLLTLGCGEGQAVFTAGANTREGVAGAQDPSPPRRVSVRHFERPGEERGSRGMWSAPAQLSD